MSARARLRAETRRFAVDRRRGAGAGPSAARSGARPFASMTAAGNQAVQRSRRAHVSPTRRSQPLTAGAVLPAHTRVQLERQLGRSLGSVRVHTGDRAAAAARSLGALAFTTGRNIAFARGQYAPDTATGRRLLVHEIVHAALHADAQRIFRKCDPAGYPPAPDTCEFRDDVPAGRRFSYIVNCDEPRHGEDVAMAAFAKSLAPSAKVHVTGLASADGDATFNRSLSCHRADDAATRLSKAGAVVGRVTAAGPVGALGDDSNRAVVVEIDSPSPVPKPKPHSKPDPKPVDARMCGPAMDASLDATLGAVRSKFSAYTRIQREDNCAQLVSIDVFKAGGFINAWDVDELFVKDSGWLDKHPVHPPCCTPLDPSDVESKTTCGRTIEVGGKCFVAGMVNYVLFGQISRLYFDEFPAGLSRLGGLVVIAFDRTVTLNRATVYKLITVDDPGPPLEWAGAGFDGVPARKGSTANRPECPPTCPYKQPTMVLTWIWEPNQPR